MKKLLLLSFFAIFLLFTILMIPSNNVINASAYNILDFEFMFNQANYEKIIEGWSDTELNAVKVNTWLDFGWLAGYGGLLFLINYLLIEKKIINKRYLKSVAYSGLIAAVFDFVEDVILLLLVYRYPYNTNFLPFLVSVIAAVKFMLVIYSFTATVINLVFIALKNKNKQINTMI